MNEQETIADIIAEMRIFKCCNLETGELELCNAIANYLADRLEAARNRELSKNASKNGADFGQLGDAAKLREALCEILSYIESFHKYIIPGKREKTTALFAVADTIRNKARTALAAPPRNCDRYATAEEARQAWLDDAGNWDEFGSPKLELHEWLYAPATEKEGGDDGQK